MQRTTIRVPAEPGFDTRMVIGTFSQIVESYGYQKKNIQGEPCWSKGDGVIVKQQNFGIAIGEREIVLQGWMNDAVTGESDLEGMVAVVPKKKMKNILEEVEIKIMPIVSTKAEGVRVHNTLPKETYKSQKYEKKADYNRKIQECKKYISEIYMELGKQYYVLYEDKPDEKLEVLVNRVKDYFMQIEELHKKIEELTKQDINCPKCEKILAEGALYCSNCGTKIQKEIIEETRKKICTQCGSIIPTDGNFCSVCGAKYISG